MTKKTRTILFLICLFLFLLIAPTAIFYSQGYRFDIDSKKITQTGGLFLKVLPKSVKIYLDEKLEEKTDFFFGSILIENLLPKKYKIRIEKAGFFPWEKTLEIKEKEVTEAKNIVLFPENPDFNILTKGVKDFWFSPDQKKIIFSEVNEEGWALKLYDLEKNVKSHLIKEEEVYQKGADLLNLEFSGSKEVSLEVGMAEQLKYFTLELDKTPPVLIEKEKELLPIFENVLFYQIIGQDIYYLDNFGHLFKTDSSFELKEKITEIPFKVKPETEYKLSIGRWEGSVPEYIFLWEGEVLHLFNPNSKSFEKFFEPIKDIKISPDFKKLVYFSDSEIWIFFLKEIADQPQKKAGEKLFLIRLSEKIGDCFWLNSDYLIFNAADKLKIAEIDDRDRINLVGLADEFKEPKIFWNQFDKKLYVLSEENLYQSGGLLK